VPGATPNITPDGSILILEAPSVNLATYDANGNPIAEAATLAQRTFGTTGAFPSFSPVPEPSTALLMPLLVVALLVIRIPAVRSFLGGGRWFIGAR